VFRFTRAASRTLLAVVLAACGADGDDGGGRAGGDGGAAPPVPRPAAASARAAIVDDFGDTLRLAAPPARVVSLNPTTTEVMFALGVGDRLVGRSRWDLWPAAAARVPAVGDGIRPNVEAVLATRPELVVLYASADNRAAARALREAGVATLAVKVDSIAEFRRVTRTLGDVMGQADVARATVDSVDATLARVRRLTSAGPRPTLLWRAWDAPLMVIGGGSYLTELFEIAGGRNVFADDPRPSPQVSFEEVLRRNPDRMIVTSDASVAKLRVDARWRTLPAVRDNRLVVVDGDLLARPSVRLGEAAVQLASRLHPALADSLLAPR
jgi:iron complex transport system substrate-binding protein